MRHPSLRLENLVPSEVRDRVAKYVGGQSGRPGYQAVQATLAEDVLNVAGFLRVLFRASPSIAAMADGGLAVEIRLDKDHELSLEIAPSGRVEAAIVSEEHYSPIDAGTLSEIRGWGLHWVTKAQ